ncbi:hypothetical protein SAMN05443507_10496 [Alicyclobacillus tolerans]|uniref:Uncharacterized protein n=1 Tax=Alicyclobacillus tolerans TaxID=90970 RepID=A0A1M6MKV6_9BACL|nr:hypothetical protein SAMN05443507_10496 [Alicyclobacillus montanus]
MTNSSYQILFAFAYFGWIAAVCGVAAGAFLLILGFKR